MKAWPAYVVVVVVIIAAAAHFIAFGTGSRSSDDSQLADLQNSVDLLTARVGVVQLTLDKLTAKLDAMASEPRAGGPVEEVNENTVAPATRNLDPVNVILEIDEAGHCGLAGQPVQRDNLVTTLKATLRANPAMQLVVKSHEELAASELHGILKQVREAGIYRVSLQTEGRSDAPE